MKYHVSYLAAYARFDSLIPHLTHLEGVRGPWQDCIGGLIRIDSVQYRSPMSVPNAAGLSRIWVQLRALVIDEPVENVELLHDVEKTQNAVLNTTDISRDEASTLE